MFLCNVSGVHTVSLRIHIFWDALLCAWVRGTCNGRQTQWWQHSIDTWGTYTNCILL